MTDINRLEAKMAKRDGGSEVKNSGRGLNKGDAKIDYPCVAVLVDYKFTDGKSYSLNVEAFNKHRKDALKVAREPVVVAVFQNYDREVAMIEWSMLKELLEAYYLEQEV